MIGFTKLRARWIRRWFGIGCQFVQSTGILSHHLSSEIGYLRQLVLKSISHEWMLHEAQGELKKLLWPSLRNSKPLFLSNSIKQVIRPIQIDEGKIRLHPLLVKWSVLRDILLHCVKIDHCEWFHKKLNAQFRHRYRRDLWTKRHATEVLRSTSRVACGI